jgi:CubicO group peptidase (beta-lactamase class C family)
VKPSSSKVFITFFLSCTLIIVHGQKPYYPDTAWQMRTPSELKLNAKMIDSAVSFAIRNEVNMDHDLRIANLKAYSNEPGYKMMGPMQQRGGPAGMIIKNGYIAAQWGDVKRVDMTFSAAKSYLSTVAGLAVDAKLIRNVDEKVKEYVWDGNFDGTHNGKITWRHLLDQSSDWSGCLFDICDWADRPEPRNGTLDEWKNRKLYEPGTRYKYNDVRVNLLAYSLLQVWRKPLPAVLKEKIMDPIGASPTWRWYGYENSFVNVDGIMMQSVSGGGHFGGGLFINTLDHARFGLLFARQGKWKGQQLLSEQWIRMATQPSAANNSYGFMWWINQNEALGKVSKSIYYAAGFGGNYIIIDPDHDLVIVTRWLEPSKLAAFAQLILQAVQ